MGPERGPSKALFFPVAMLGVAFVFLATLVGGGATPRTLGGRDRGVGASLLNLALGDGDGFHTSIVADYTFSMESATCSVKIPRALNIVQQSSLSSNA